MQLVGELEYARSRVRAPLGGKDDTDQSNELDRITGELRETVATIWLQPAIGQTERRSKRISGSDSEFAEATAAAPLQRPNDTLHRLAPIGPETLAGRRMLVIDDSLFYRELAIVAVQAAGGRITAVKDIPAAVEVLQRDELFDAVLADVELPDIHDRALAACIRGGKKSAAFIGLVSRATAASQSQARTAGFDKCVAKFHTRQLIAAVADLCTPKQPRTGACA
jgi:CheY-like chemotaxis protein